MTNVRLAAAQAQQKTFQGRTCPSCGANVRYTSSGQCIACQRVKSLAASERIRSLLRGDKQP